MHIWTQKSASIQLRTSCRKSENRLSDDNRQRRLYVRANLRSSSKLVTGSKRLTLQTARPRLRQIAASWPGTTFETLLKLNWWSTCAEGIGKELEIHAAVVTSQSLHSALALAGASNLCCDELSSSPDDLYSAPAHPLSLPNFERSALGGGYRLDRIVFRGENIERCCTFAVVVVAPYYLLKRR